MDLMRLIMLGGGAVMVLALFVPRLRGLLLTLGYGGVMYGLLGAVHRGLSPETGLIVPALILNAVLLVGAGLWVIAGKVKKRIQPLAVVLLVVAVGFTWISVELAPDVDLAAFARLEWGRFWRGAGGDLEVHFIDVGQGDAILIQTAEKDVLIDAGSRGEGETVANYLRSLGVKHLDLVIATHPHEDHIGGLLTVLDQFTVGEVMDPGVPHTTVTFETYLDLIEANNIPFTVARAGMVRDLGNGITLTVVHPQEPLASGLNDVSIVVRLTGAGVNFIFAGDIEASYERQLVESGQSLAAQVLKVAHHGSYSSTSEEFFAAVRPRYAVIMAGVGNRYQHPHQETLELLQSAGVELYRTDLHGTVVMTVKDGQLSIYTERQADAARLFEPGR